VDDGTRLSRCKTFRDIVSGRGPKQKLVTIAPAHTVAEAVELMKKYDIEHIPVMNGDGPMGAISESGLFQKVFLIRISGIPLLKV